MIGRGRSVRQRYLTLAPVAGLFSATFLGDALGVFTVAGGVVFVPGDAVLVGGVGAAYLGYRHDGLVVAWFGMYAALLGYSADHSLLGLSGRSPVERVSALLQLDGLVFLGVETLVLGTLAFLLGVCCEQGVAVVYDAFGDTHPR